jgi:DNA-binding response OmpR family regulator
MAEHGVVLMIEDDQAIADLYRGRLSKDGYDVTVASDGEEGLELARSMVPSLIYLDLRLPKLSGFDVLRQLRSTDLLAGTPVVILTNYDAAEVRSTGLELGAQDVLLKSETTPAQLAGLTAQLVDC